MHDYISVPDAIRELAKRGIKMTRQGLYGKVKRGTIPSKQFGSKTKVKLSDILLCYGGAEDIASIDDVVEKQTPKVDPKRHKSPPNNIDEHMKRLLSDNQNTKPLTRVEQIVTLAMIQKKFALVALGEYETAKISYKFIDGEYQEVSKVVQTHLPSLEFAKASGIVGDMLNELDNVVTEWETNEEAVERYLRYGLKN